VKQGLLWWLQIIRWWVLTSEKQTNIMGVQFGSFVCGFQLLFDVSLTMFNPGAEECWGLIQHLVQRSVEECILNCDW